LTRIFTMLLTRAVLAEKAHKTACRYMVGADCATRSHYTKLVAHTVGRGKLMRGELVLSAYGGTVTPYVINGVMSAELMHAGFLVADDLADQSATRYGQPTWYREVGSTQAHNDANFLLNLGATAISDHGSIVKNFHKTCIASVLGQTADLSRRPSCPSKSIALYDDMCFAKTGRYSFEYPILTGLFLNASFNVCPTIRLHVRTLSASLASVFQSQNDISNLVAFGKNPGSDMALRRPTWPSAFCAAVSPTPAVLQRCPEALMDCLRNHDVQKEYDFYVQRHLKNAEDTVAKLDVMDTANIFPKCLKIVNNIVSKNKSKCPTLSPALTLSR
jgi:geranylgeranyl pyrophosphate synthase